MGANLVKGILILLVVLDHNDYIRGLYNTWLNPLSFHVLGFLALPFALERASQSSLADKAIRYWYPHLVFLTLASLLFQFVIKSDTGMIEFFTTFGTAVITGSGDHVKLSSGFLMFWFLPCLFSIVVLKSLVDKLAISSTWWVALLFLATYFMLFIPDQVIKHAPMSALLAIYLLPQCMLIGVLYRKICTEPNRLYVGLAGMAFSGLLFWLCQQNGVILEYSRFYVPKPIGLWLLANIANMGMALSIILVFSFTQRAPWFLVQIGQFSLGVYLVHNFVYFVERKLFGSVSGEWPLLVTVAAIEILLVTFVSLLIIKGIFKVERLKRLTFPKDGRELTSALRLSR